jgi:hypothetical protein
MLIVCYLVSIVAFYLAYFLSTLLLGRLAVVINEAVTKSIDGLKGYPLLFVSCGSNYLSFFSISIIFMWFNYQPNWYIITPIMVFIWFNIAPHLYRPHFLSGAAHWGMTLGITIFFATK